MNDNNDVFELIICGSSLAAGHGISEITPSELYLPQSLSKMNIIKSTTC